ncbi:acetyl-CoA carboxylase biotin carboxyl carrier protein [Geobacter pelophilus]|uniref:Biotin carboxyl carrier protein of acetyl-CoA carboxylase n=1 Tax=Geoanaerobacter pelophilus TaxID=60036 RepID=A0AAW4L3B8_9BACT|nr:acetyl-CoA carboxylase biotin carboxyl carrier protein [Geoanaerobacter pelophilus]MBT0665644.1 acetyl-CoA carboxylase biotin carboxyl carrier protein [Geoanaerobacter pelophilus]
MDIKDIKTLIKMVTETDITEFEIENPEERILIKRGTSTEVVHVQAPQVMAAPQAIAAAHPQVAGAPAAAAAPVAEKGDPITSPIVGTFYRAPAPDAAPYVEVGQVVEKGQVLCIVEAMKLMNEIEAEYRCKIVKICKENAQPVEFGDALFLVEKA